MDVSDRLSLPAAEGGARVSTLSSREREREVVQLMAAQKEEMHSGSFCYQTVRLSVFVSGIFMLRPVCIFRCLRRDPRRDTHTHSIRLSPTVICIQTHTC